MTAETHGAMSALQQALELERSGYRFYTRAAERTADPKGSEMFRALASDEMLHQQAIERQIEALGQGAGWVLPAGIDRVEVDLVSPLFPAGKMMPSGGQWSMDCRNANISTWSALMARSSLPMPAISKIRLMIEC